MWKQLCPILVLEELCTPCFRFGPRLMGFLIRFMGLKQGPCGTTFAHTWCSCCHGNLLKRVSMWYSCQHFSSCCYLSKVSLQWVQTLRGTSQRREADWFPVLETTTQINSPHTKRFHWLNKLCCSNWTIRFFSPHFFERRKVTLIIFIFFISLSCHHQWHNKPSMLI